MFWVHCLSYRGKYSGKENVNTNQGLAASTSSFRASTLGERLCLGSLNLITIEDFLIDTGRSRLMTQSLSLISSKHLLDMHAQTVGREGLGQTKFTPFVFYFVKDNIHTAVMHEMLMSAAFHSELENQASIFRTN
uniref:Uncharacterized protein n=1 Tax=Glossina austeni TaxID=7395 RepID=A0A1A9VTK7_GLOAU